MCPGAVREGSTSDQVIGDALGCADGINGRLQLFLDLKKIR
jgi:hypothetical protein